MIHGGKINSSNNSRGSLISCLHAPLCGLCVVGLLLFHIFWSLIAIHYISIQVNKVHTHIGRSNCRVKLAINNYFAMTTFEQFTHNCKRYFTKELSLRLTFNWILNMTMHRFHIYLFHFCSVFVFVFSSPNIFPLKYIN